MKNKVLDFVQLILSIILILTPKLIAPVCHYDIHSHEAPMKCFYMGETVIFISGAIVFLMLIKCFIKNEDINTGLHISNIVILLCVMYISKIGIGGCSHSMMSCQASTIPTVMTICIITAIFSLGKIINYFKNEKNNI